MAAEVLVVIHGVFIEIVMHQQLMICLPTSILVYYTFAFLWAAFLLMVHPILVAIILLLAPIWSASYEALCGLIKRWLGGIMLRITWHQSAISLCNERKKRKNALHRVPCMIQQVWVVSQWTKRNNEENEMSTGGRQNLPVESIEVSVNKKGSCLLAVHKCSIINLWGKATGSTEFCQLSALIFMLQGTYHIQSFTPKIFAILDATWLSQDSTEQKYSKVQYRKKSPYALNHTLLLHDVTYCLAMYLLSAAPCMWQASKIKEQLLWSLHLEPWNNLQQ